MGLVPFRFLGVCLAFLGTAAPLLAAPVRLSGGFIQYWNSMVNGPNRLTREQWIDVVKAMYEAKLDTIIIQNLALRNPKFESSFIREGADDATEAILDYAD